MQIETTLAGSYPKLPTQPGDANLRVVRNRRDQGEAQEQAGTDHGAHADHDEAVIRRLPPSKSRPG